MSTQHLEEESDTISNKEYLRCIEMDIDKALFEAEALLLNYPAYSWTMKIHHANFLVNYWVTLQSYRRNRMVGLDVLEDLKDMTPPDLDIYQGDIARPPQFQLHKA
eukprot:301437-Ditylum_brightwellii.AAC.1